MNDCLPIERWFDQQDWPVLDFQRQAWQAYAEGQSGLIHAPTGSGKTLAAWGGAVNELIAQDSSGGGLSMLWITPLRALAADTCRALNRPLEGLRMPDAVALRTGDTSAYRRKKLLEQPPPALVTTPESLSLMLSYADGSKRMSRLKAVFIDEWHELMSSKRGVLLQLSLARLRALNPGLKVWGLSATIGNLDDALAGLLTADEQDVDRPGLCIQGRIDRPIEIDTLLPDSVERFPLAGRMGLPQLRAVVDRIEQSDSTLVFTNTRNQAENWFGAIQSVSTEPETIALHHGSIDRELRDLAEQGLAGGRLKCVVATSSLDLGVDFSPVDQVIQIGSPKGIARLIQRAGRAGHQPGGCARIVCVPTHALEIIELAAVRNRLWQGKVEAREPVRLALDVLAQHLVTIALGGGFEPDRMFDEVRTSPAFSDLSRQQWQWTLDFITRGGPALEAYPNFHKVERVDGRMRVTDRRIGMLHRLNIGTITADGALQVRFVKGAALGQVEERFITRLRPGERFIFAGRSLELVRVRDMTAYVRKASSKKATVPSWAGGRMPLSTLLADGMLALFDEYVAGCAHPTPESESIAPLIALQQRASAMPGRGHLLIEQLQSRDGAHWFVYPFAGRLAHEGLAALLAFRISRLQPVTFSITVNDYGIELLSAKAIELEAADWRDVLTIDHLTDDIEHSLDAANMAKYRFRDIARVAGMVQQGFPGRGKPVRHLQASSGLIFDVLKQHDPDHLLLEQARREVLESQLELGRIRAALERAAEQRLMIRRPERLTPLAFPLWADRLRSQLSSEDWQTRVDRMLGQLETAAGVSSR
ncbi:MAG: ligase-associated DNA damage response DEXH box helicase [Pseudomonadota bacterium]